MYVGNWQEVQNSCILDLLGRKVEGAGVRLQRDLYTFQRYSVGSEETEGEARQEDEEIRFFKISLS